MIGNELYGDNSNGYGNGYGRSHQISEEKSIEGMVHSQLSWLMLILFASVVHVGLLSSLMYVTSFT